MTVQAPDGSPVEVFRALGAGQVPDLIHGAVPAGSSILDLGCGAGRLSRPLATLGHPVTAVDSSPDMLASVRPPVRGVLGEVDGLELGTTFEVVLLASYLVNHPELAVEYLRAARRHLAPGGVVIVQRYDPGWVIDATPDCATVGDVTIAVGEFVVDPPLFRATVTYGIGMQHWRQDIRARIVDNDTLDALAEQAGLGLERWLDDFETWGLLRSR